MLIYIFLKLFNKHKFNLLLLLLLLLFLNNYSLRPIDIEFMSRLHHRVNLIPVIAKSDILSDEEIKQFKARVCIK